MPPKDSSLDILEDCFGMVYRSRKASLVSRTRKLELLEKKRLMVREKEEIRVSKDNAAHRKLTQDDRKYIVEAADDFDEYLDDGAQKGGAQSKQSPPAKKFGMPQFGKSLAGGGGANKYSSTGSKPAAKTVQDYTQSTQQSRHRDDDDDDLRLPSWKSVQQKTIAKMNRQKENNNRSQSNRHFKSTLSGIHENADGSDEDDGFDDGPAPRLGQCNK
jgi:hypothetical protein